MCVPFSTTARVLGFLILFCSLLVSLIGGQCCMPVLSETLCNFARYGPVPRVAPVYVPRVFGGRCAICCCVGSAE